MEESLYRKRVSLRDFEDRYRKGEYNNSLVFTAALNSDDLECVQFLLSNKEHLLPKYDHTSFIHEILYSGLDEKIKYKLLELLFSHGIDPNIDLEKNCIRAIRTRSSSKHVCNGACNSFFLNKTLRKVTPGKLRLLFANGLDPELNDGKNNIHSKYIRNFVNDKENHRLDIQSLRNRINKIHRICVRAGITYKKQVYIYMIFIIYLLYIIWQNLYELVN